MGFQMAYISYLIWTARGRDPKGEWLYSKPHWLTAMTSPVSRQ